MKNFNSLIIFLVFCGFLFLEASILSGHWFKLVMIFQLVLSARLIWDFDTIENKHIIPNHGARWMTTAVILMFNTIWLPGDYERLVTLFAQCAAFWWLFDLLLNLLRDKEPFYIGGGFWDKKLGVWLWPVKLVFTFGVVALGFAIL